MPPGSASTQTIEADIDSNQLGNVFFGNEAYAEGAVINRGSDSGKEELTKRNFFGGNSAHGSGSSVLNGHADNEVIAAMFNRNKKA